MNTNVQDMSSPLTPNVTNNERDTKHNLPQSSQDTIDAVSTPLDTRDDAKSADKADEVLSDKVAHTGSGDEKPANMGSKNKSEEKVVLRVLIYCL